MNRLSFLFLSLFVLCAVHTVSAQRVEGNGQVVTQTREVAAFDELNSHGSFNIVVTDGNDHAVKVEAEENLQQYVIVEVRDGKLHIRNKPNVNFHAKKDITVHVTAPSLKGVKLSGSGNVKSTNTLNGSPNFEIKSSGSGNVTLSVEATSLIADISGSGNMTLNGKTKELDSKIAGSGNIRAKGLQSDITSIKISGSGNAEVVANEKLSSKIAGSGEVRYWGNASVDSKVAGSGSIKRISE